MGISCWFCMLPKACSCEHWCSFHFWFNYRKSGEGGNGSCSFGCECRSFHSQWNKAEFGHGRYTLQCSLGFYWRYVTVHTYFVMICSKYWEHSGNGYGSVITILCLWLLLGWNCIIKYYRVSYVKGEICYSVIPDAVCYSFTIFSTYIFQCSDFEYMALNSYTGLFFLYWTHFLTSPNSFPGSWERCSSHSWASIFSCSSYGYTDC